MSDRLLTERELEQMRETAKGVRMVEGRLAQRLARFEDLKTGMPLYQLGESGEPVAKVSSLNEDFVSVAWRGAAWNTTIFTREGVNSPDLERGHGPTWDWCATPATSGIIPGEEYRRRDAESRGLDWDTILRDMEESIEQRIKAGAPLPWGAAVESAAGTVSGGEELAIRGAFTTETFKAAMEKLGENVNVGQWTREFRYAPYASESPRYGDRLYFDELGFVNKAECAVKTRMLGKKPAGVRMHAADPHLYWFVPCGRGVAIRRSPFAGFVGLGAGKEFAGRSLKFEEATGPVETIVADPFASDVAAMTALSEDVNNRLSARAEQCAKARLMTESDHQCDEDEVS
jgi:hypothetical protein